MKDVINIIREHRATAFLFATLGITLILFLTLFLFGKTIVAFKEADKLDSKYPENTISVSGMGEVIAIPDIAQFTFTVSERAEDSTTAQTAVTKRANKIYEELEKYGIDSKDIKTTSYNIYPNYSYEIMGMPCPEGDDCPVVRESVVTSYEVRQTTSVKVREIERAGEFLSIVGSFGVNNVSGLTFVVDDIENMYEEAVALAIADAKVKAQKVANELGVKLVRIVGYHEDYASPYRSEYDMSFSSKAVSEEIPQIYTGESEIRKTVNITFEIK